MVDVLRHGLITDAKIYQHAMHVPSRGVKSLLANEVHEVLTIVTAAAVSCPTVQLQRMINNALQHRLGWRAVDLPLTVRHSSPTTTVRNPHCNIVHCITLH